MATAVPGTTGGVAGGGGGGGAASSGVALVGELAFSTLLVFAPALGYLDQLNAIRRSRRYAEGYAASASFILLASNVLRVGYYVAGVHFATALLLQSLWMISVQTALVVVVINAMFLLDRSRISFGPVIGRRQAEGYIATRTARRFLLELLGCIVVVIAVALLVGAFLPTAASFLGYLALAIEATLIVPQLRLNKERQSVAGVTWSLLATWVGGDVVKMVYFVVSGQPTPFVVCGCVQLALDAVLVYQLLSYGHQPGPGGLTAIRDDDEDEEAATAAGGRGAMDGPPTGHHIPSVAGGPHAAAVPGGGSGTGLMAFGLRSTGTPVEAVLFGTPTVARGGVVARGPSAGRTDGGVVHRGGGSSAAELHGGSSCANGSSSSQGDLLATGGAGGGGSFTAATAATAMAAAAVATPPPPPSTAGGGGSSRRSPPIP